MQKLKKLNRRFRRTKTNNSSFKLLSTVFVAITQNGIDFALTLS